MAVKQETIKRAVTLRDNVTYSNAADGLTFMLANAGIANAEEIVAKLVDRFGNVQNAIYADVEEYANVDFINRKTFDILTSIVSFARITVKSANDVDRALRNSDLAANYCKGLLLGEKREMFYCICLNARCMPIGKRLVSIGSLSEVSAYPRTIAETALSYNAHAVILTHNHPGGTFGPSREDVDSTIQIQRLLKALGVMLLDHFIIANNEAYSMVQHGDISYK